MFFFFLIIPSQKSTQVEYDLKFISWVIENKMINQCTLQEHDTNFFFFFYVKQSLFEIVKTTLLKKNNKKNKIKKIGNCAWDIIVISHFAGINSHRGFSLRKRDNNASTVATLYVEKYVCARSSCLFSQNFHIYYTVNLTLFSLFPSLASHAQHLLAIVPKVYGELQGHQIMSPLIHCPNYFWQYYLLSTTQLKYYIYN